MVVCCPPHGVLAVNRLPFGLSQRWTMGSGAERPVGRAGGGTVLGAWWRVWCEEKPPSCPPPLVGSGLECV